MLSGSPTDCNWQVAGSSIEDKDIHPRMQAFLSSVMDFGKPASAHEEARL
jgi:hypothetical protein